MKKIEFKMRGRICKHLTDALLGTILEKPYGQLPINKYYCRKNYIKGRYLTTSRVEEGKDSSDSQRHFLH